MTATGFITVNLNEGFDSMNSQALFSANVLLLLYAEILGLLGSDQSDSLNTILPVSYTHLRAHET